MVHRTSYILVGRHPPFQFRTRCCAVNDRHHLHLTAYVPVPVRESAYESTQAGIQQEQGIGHLMLGSDGPDAETASEHNQESEVVESAEQGQRAGRSTPLLHEMFSATTRPKTAPSNNGYLPSPPQSPTQSLYGTPAQSPPISAAPAQGFFGIEPVASPAPMSDRPSTSLGISHAAPPTPRSSSSSSVRAATNIDAYVPRENMPPTAHPSPSPSPVQSLTETRVRSLAPGKDLSVSPSTSDSSSSSTRPVSNAFNHTRAPIFTSTGPLASHKPPSDPPGVPLWEFSRRLGAGPQSEPLTPVGANTNMEQRRPQLGEPMFCFALEGRLQLAVEGEEDAIEVRWAELRRIDDDAFLGYAYVDSRGEWRGWW
ncbi:hypothetical protein BKA62DRAFT_77612 [Auriculariales sp. MPI-PUGE-AT-0066]|nr:hypothetical protein BKA62DRAFT_77612 [Auriculariales sp. MPI-PUGE-AT-0066]